MLLYFSLFFMIVTCLAGAYTVADWLMKSFCRVRSDAVRLQLLLIAEKTKGLEIALRDALEQDAEIILVDCGMSEEQRKIAEKTAARYLRVRTAAADELTKYVQEAALKNSDGSGKTGK